MSKRESNLRNLLNQTLWEMAGKLAAAQLTLADYLRLEQLAEDLENGESVPIRARWLGGE